MSFGTTLVHKSMSAALSRIARKWNPCKRLLEMRARGEDPPLPEKPSPEKNDELRELSEMLNHGELSTIKRHGGKMHREFLEEDVESVSSHQPRLLLKDPDAVTPPMGGVNGRLGGIYQNVSIPQSVEKLMSLICSI